MSYLEKGAIKLLLIFITGWLLAPGLSAQDRKLLASQVKLQKKSYELRDLMDEVSRQHSLSIAYDSKKIPSFTRIQVTRAPLSIKDVLKLLKTTKGIRFKQRGKHIILLPPVKKSFLKKKEIRTLVKVKTPESKALTAPPAGDTLPAKSELPALLPPDTAIISPSDDTLTTAASSNTSFQNGESPSALSGMAAYTPKQGVPVVQYTPSSRAAETTYPTVRRYVKAHDPDYFSRGRNQQKAFFGVGTIANEVYYIGLTGQAGIKNLFVDGTLFQNRGKVHWRLGIKGSFNFNQSWSATLGYQSGQALTNEAGYEEIRTEVITITPDSAEPYDSTIYIPFNHNIAVKGTWSTFDLGARYNLNDFLSITGAVTYNILRQNYEATNNSFSDPAGQIPGEKLPAALRTPHNLLNDTREKRWFGGQLTILYHF